MRRYGWMVGLSMAVLAIGGCATGPTATERADRESPTAGDEIALTALPGEPRHETELPSDEPALAELLTEAPEPEVGLDREHPIPACGIAHAHDVIRTRVACPAGERPLAWASEDELASAAVHGESGEATLVTYSMPCLTGPTHVYVDVGACAFAPEAMESEGPVASTLDAAPAWMVTHESVAARPSSDF